MAETILVALEGNIKLTINEVTGDPYEVDVGRDSGPLVGTITVVMADTAIVGVGTSFLTDFVAGDQIETVGGQRRTITDVTDNTNMVVSLAWDASEAAVTYIRIAVGLYDGTSYRDLPTALPQTQSVDSGFVVTQQNRSQVEERDDFNHVEPRVVALKRTRTIFPRGANLIRWVWTDQILGLGDAIARF